MTARPVDHGTIADALRWGAAELTPSDTASLDAQLLLGHVLDRSRAGLIAHELDSMRAEDWSAYQHLIKRRARGEPVAYLRGHTQWYGTDYLVTRDVLIPRPETEFVLETALALIERIRPGVVVDVGTGSGAIVSQLALMGRNVRLFATDISPGALSVALSNLRRLGVEDRVTLLHGNLLEPVPEVPNLVVANLPYLSESMLDDVSADVRFEPREALHGGRDGLALYAEMLEQLRKWGDVPVVAEIDPRQSRATLTMFSHALPGLSVDIFPDYAGRPRVVVAAPSGALESCRTR